MKEPESGKVCDWYLSDGRKLGDLHIGDLQAIVDELRGEPERARQRDAWMAEAILRHIAQTKLALEQAWHAYVAAVSNLTKLQQKDEVLRMMAALGLDIEDFG